MIFLETSTAVNKADIEQIEMNLGIVFPNDFVLHYLQYNGGYPQADTYKWPNGESTTVNTFYSLKNEGFWKNRRHLPESRAYRESSATGISGFCY